MHPFTIEDALRYGWRMTRRFFLTLIGLGIVFLVLGWLQESIGESAGIAGSFGQSAVYNVIWFVINGFFAVGALTMIFDLMDRGATSWSRLVAPTEVVVRYLWTSVVFMGVMIAAAAVTGLTMFAVAFSQIDDMSMLSDGVRTLATAAVHGDDAAIEAGAAAVGQAMSDDGMAIVLAALPSIAIVGVVLIAAMSLLFGLAYFLAVDKDLSGIAALRASYYLIKGHLFYYMLFNGAAMIIALLGLLAFGVGLVVALPVVMIASVYVYRALDGRVPAMPAAADDTAQPQKSGDESADDTVQDDTETPATKD